MDQIIEEDGKEKESTFDQIGPSTSNGGIMNKTALDILLKMIRKEMGNIQMGIGPPKAEQCPQQNVQELCDEKPLWNALMGHGFLIIFCLAIVGNCLNLFIYNSDQIRFFIAIRMLCTKLLMNTLMMVVMLPQAFRGIHLWEIGSAMDKIYWRFWPYQAYLTNVFGFCAMWLTVLMTAECYVHIFFPSKSKVLCTKKTVWRGYLLILLTALILASIYPLNRNISFTTKCQKMIVKIVTSQHPFMQFLEKIHAIADLLLAILIPLSLLVFMTIMIVWRLWVWPIRHFRQQNASASSLNPTPPPSSSNLLLTKNSTKIERKTTRGKHFAAEKRGVTRITLITCCIQLITETPSMSVLIYATMFGPNVHKKAAYFDICTWQTISYFLCLCNASLSFFVYITFSTRFRQTMTNRAQLILHRFCPSLFKEAASAFSQKGRRHQPMPNSSCTSHSHLAIMSSKNESPRKSSPNINERITSPNLFIVKK